MVLLALSFLEVSAQETFYVSSSGNDSNNGLSPSAPWKTIPYVQSGKTYLLNKGDTLSFSVGATSNTNPASKIKISSYGSGNKPVLSLYKKVKSSAWTQHYGNIWKANIASSANFTGPNITDTNIGFIKVNGKIYGNKLASLNSLASAWDFYCDNTYIYVYSTQNPSGQKIEAAPNASAINVSDNMEISDISICGSGAHGISAHERSNVILRSIDINEIGGSFLSGYGDGTTRYGNGIEFFNKASNCIIVSCSVKQVYDVAFTMQGTGKFSNVIFQGNTADKNEQTFETWLGSGSEGFKGCKFINNLCYNAGFGWSHDVRPVKDIGVHILTYLWQVNDNKAQDLLIQGNTFSKAKSGLWYWGIWDAAPPATSKNNIVTLDVDTPIRSLVSTYTVKNSKDFVSATGLEAGTVFNSVKTDQSISFAALPSKTTENAPFTLQATASSKLTVGFTVASGPATISGTMLTLNGVGTVVVTASQAGDSFYNTAPSVSQSFNVTAPAGNGNNTVTGTILLEQWMNAPGTEISDIPLNTTPSSSTILSSFEAPANFADYYGSRISGYLTPKQTGNYTFWISGDDKAELWLSTDDDADKKIKIAYTDSWTNVQEYTKYASQKSISVALTAGKKYYIEALQKEGPGGDNLSVQWQLPDGAVQNPLPGNVLSPFTGNREASASGTLILEQWLGVSGNRVDEIPVQKTPSTSVKITAFEAPSNTADNYGSRIRGYVTPAVSGNYTFWIACDDTGELWLSTDDNVVNKVKIAYTDQWTNVREYNKYSSQKSAVISLVAGKKYYIEALQKEGPGGDNLSVQWQLPNGSIQTPISGSYISPFETSQLRIATTDLFTNPVNSGNTEELVSSGLNVFPNPASDQSTIIFSTSEDGQAQVVLFNMSGQLVKSLFKGKVKANVETTFPIKTESLTNGTYIIDMVNGKNRLTKKLVILKN